MVIASLLPKMCFHHHGDQKVTTISVFEGVCEGVVAKTGSFGTDSQVTALSVLAGCRGAKTGGFGTISIRK